MELANFNSPSSSSDPSLTSEPSLSFTVITDSNISEDMFNSTPVESASAFDESQFMNISPIQSPDRSTQAEPQIPITTTQTRKLPLLSDGCTLDKEYLELIWVNEDPDITFDDWCTKMHISKQMKSRNLVFGVSFQKQKLFKNDPEKATTVHNQWKDSFHLHFQTFDEWYKPDPPNNQPRSNLSNPPFVSLPRLHIDAIAHLHTFPSTEQKDYKYLYLTWSSTLIRDHNLSFAEWVSSPSLKANFADNIEYGKQLDQRVEPPSLQPYIYLFQTSQEQILEDFNNMHNFVIDSTVRSALRQAHTFPNQEAFLPRGSMSHMYTPPYVHLPHNTLNLLKLLEYKNMGHVKHIIWSRMKSTVHSAYKNSEHAFTKFANTDQFEQVSPFVRLYRSQSEHVLHPPITAYQVTQHIMAHEHLKHIGGLASTTEHEFYDLFIRPLEFLITRGTPLHSQLLAAMLNYNERFNLFRNLIEIAGFNIHERLPAKVHQVYQELARTRHLDPYDLTDINYDIQMPLHRVDTLPLGLDRHPTRTPAATIQIRDFQTGGRLFNYRPETFIPVPHQYLDKFPELGGRKISIIDHHNLHTEALRVHQNFVKYQNNSFKPILSQQPELQVRPRSPPKLHHVLPERPPPLRSSNPSRKTHQAATSYEARDLIENDIKLFKEKEAAKQPVPQPRQALPERPPPVTRQPAIHPSTVHTFAALETTFEHNLFPPNPPPLLSAEDMWRYDTFPPSQLNPATTTTTTTTDISYAFPTQTEQETDQQLLQSKPAWILDKLPPLQPGNMKILVGDFLWSGLPDEHIPDACRYPHSAASIAANMVRLSTSQHIVRYIQKPYYRKAPIDGIFTSNNWEVHYSNLQQNEQVHADITQYDTDLKGKNPLNLRTQGTKLRLNIPTNILHRIITFIDEVNLTPMPPRVTDVESGLDVLVCKTQRIKDFELTISVNIHRKKLRSERCVHVRMTHYSPTDRQDAELYFPWYLTSEVVASSKDLYGELHHNKII